MNAQQKITEAGQSKRLFSLEKRLQTPMLFLSFIWLSVLIVELVNGKTATLSSIGTALWILFVVYFLLRLLTASKKLSLLKKNWLFILALLFSVFRFFPYLQSYLVIRTLTVTLGMQVIWIFASADQGIRFVRRALGRRGVGYVLALTSVVLFAGAAAILHFESEATEIGKIQRYPDALWWTAMQMTNIGSTYPMKSVGGKILDLTISIYSAGMFGYLTALFATLIIDRELKTPKSKPELRNNEQLAEIQKEIRDLQSLIENLTTQLTNKKQDI